MNLLLGIFEALLYIFAGWLIHDIWNFMTVERHKPLDISKQKRVRVYTSQDGELLLTFTNWESEKADAIAEEKGWVLLDSRGYEEDEK